MFVQQQLASPGSAYDLMNGQRCFKSSPCFFSSVLLINENICIAKISIVGGFPGPGRQFQAIN